TTRIPFEFPFGTTPVIHAGLTGFDLDQRDSARLKLLVTHIDPSGFDLTIRTWADTRVYSVEVSWMAIGF
ncbi:MAG: H-type lectin domain-containing protein, partial [Verrucomicrobiae bacterium]|nr:H-type lectin domain-containing protein [Verrucomicrobiae bacterium]